MKNFYVLTIIFLLSSCQTLSSIQETLGLVQEDPNAPVKLDENYESFLDVNWKKNVDKPLLNLNLFIENIESNLFFDINAGTIYNLNEKQIELFEIVEGTNEVMCSSLNSEVKYFEAVKRMEGFNSIRLVAAVFPKRS